MPEKVGKDQGVEATLARGARLGTMGLLLSGNLGISTAFGMLLLLPLYVQKLGGDEASFGIVMAAATIPAGLSIGLLIRYPEAWRPNVVLTIAVLAYGLGAAGAALVTVTWVPLVGIGVLLGTAWAVATSITALSLAFFLLVGSSTLLYGLASGFVGIGYGLALPAAQAQAVNVSVGSIRPRVLPLAGLLFETTILAFPLLAGWVISSFGYGAVFAVLVLVALVQAVLGWERFLAARKLTRPAPLRR
jgi:hypothetical protein